MNSPLAMPVQLSSTASPDLAALLNALGGVTAHVQPIVDLTTGRTLAYEALARFGNGAAPDDAFAIARERGLGPELEAAAIRAALALGTPPDGACLAVNISPSGLVHPAVADALPADLCGLTIEITEHERLAAGSRAAAVLDDLRRRGACIAIDDAGAGYAGFNQLLTLRPDVIKLDRVLVRDVHRDPAKAALVGAFVTLGRSLGATVCAEGIEELDELLALADLDVMTGQGYLLARPAPAWPEVDPFMAGACRLAQRAALADAWAGGATMEAVARHLADCASLADLDACVMAIQDVLGAEEISISRTVDDGRGLVVCAGAHWGDEPVYLVADYPATAGALATGEAVQVLADCAAADPAERALLDEHGYGALLLIPLRRRGAPAGTMEIYRRDARAWSRREITAARTVGHQVAMALGQLG
jgi:EAL domain-containing protein (putative c-di-GMP-specific phosphodiesterase class I)